MKARGISSGKEGSTGHKPFYLSWLQKYHRGREPPMKVARNLQKIRNVLKEELQAQGHSDTLSDLYDMEGSDTESTRVESYDSYAPSPSGSYPSG